MERGDGFLKHLKWTLKEGYSFTQQNFGDGAQAEERT